MDQVFRHLQQELFALRAQVAAESGLPDAVRAINNLATAQVRRDTPSLIDVKGLGRPKEFSGKEEDLQQWSKKTEAFLAGVIKESEMMLEWQLNRRRKSRRQQPISSSCRRLRMWTEERKTWSLFCSRCIQRSWLARVVERMTLSPTRGRTHWKHGGGCKSDMIPRQEEGKRNDHFSWTVLSSGTPSGDRTLGVRWSGGTGARGS